MSTFVGAYITEARIYDNPADPQNSNYKVALLITTKNAIVDPNTGEVLTQTLSLINNVLTSHIANTDIHVTLAWVNNITTLVSGLISDIATIQANMITADERNVWNNNIITASNALALAQQNAGAISDLRGRIMQIEDSLFNQMGANPFIITFGNLNGINLARGIWNAVLHRVEC